MSRWVTFYEDIFNGVSDVKIHKDKESATEHFKNNYWRYFQLSKKIDVKLPMSYGYPHRRFRGMSITSFNKVIKAGGLDG